MVRPTFALALLAALAAPAATQDSLATPQLSPHARVMHTVGATEISVDYHAPAVRGREIFGNKVPYGVVWRAGANDNTTISFEHPVTVEGRPVDAGTYGLHMIPGPERWTVILSKDSTAWGSYRYTPNNDALRAEVTPRSAPHRERLAYLFEEVTDDAAVLLLHWAELVVPVRIGVDNAAVVLAPVRERFRRGDENPTWQYWFQAAEFGRDHGVDAKETLAWVDRSVEILKGFSNLWTRSELLAELGEVTAAGEAREAALELVTADELAQLGGRYLQRDDLDSAIAVLEMVVQMDSPSWWPYDQLAGAKQRAGDLQGAADAWRLALEKNPDPVTRGEIESKLEALEVDDAG